MSYGPRIDAVIYGSDPTTDYTREDWIRLALAALDQAAVSPRELADAYRHGSRRNGGVAGVLLELDEHGVVEPSISPQPLTDTAV